MAKQGRLAHVLRVRIGTGFGVIGYLKNTLKIPIILQLCQMAHLAQLFIFRVSHAFDKASLTFESQTSSHSPALMSMAHCLLRVRGATGARGYGIKPMGVVAKPQTLFI